MSDPGVQASIHKNLKTTLPRLYNYIAATRFREVNLIDRLYPDSTPVGEPGTFSLWLTLVPRGFSLVHYETLSMSLSDIRTRWCFGHCICKY